MIARLLKQYIASWKFAFTAWPFLVLLWVVNFAFALIVIGPLTYGLERAFGNSMELSKLMKGFDYTLVMDFLREYDIVVGAVFDQSTIVILVSLLVQIFLTGGIVHLVSSKKEQTSYAQFWSNCSSFFLKYLGLSIILLLVATIVFVVLFMYFSKDGFNPFFLENEMVLINRFWWLVVIGVVFLIWLSIFRDAAKLEIYNNHESGYFRNIISGLKKSFALSFLLNGILNAAVYTLFLWIFFKIRPQFELFGWALIFISQLWLVLRVAYRVGRLRSFAMIKLK